MLLPARIGAVWGLVRACALALPSHTSTQRPRVAAMRDRGRSVGPRLICTVSLRQKVHS